MAHPSLVIDNLQYANWSQKIFRQMNGLCGDYQMPTPPERGIAANMGGDDRTSVVTTYRKRA